MTRSLRSAFVSGFVLSLLAAAPAMAQRGAGPRAAAVAAAQQQQQGKRSALTRITRAAITNRFGGNRAAFDRARDQARTRQWKPSIRWMSEEGKRYGRLLIVSDMHPGTGTDAVTGKVHPSEDFMPDRQEIDFRNFLESEWTAARADGRTRTLVLNGDSFEFMQTTTPPPGEIFHGEKDAYGPANSPRNIVSKLRAIREGHPDLFGSYAQHLKEGHRVVLLPGNHDRQLLHPAVRAALRTILRKDLAAALVADQAFSAELSGKAREQAAVKQARQILAERFELHPGFFLVGDVFVQHGHQTDPFNSFATLLGDFYGQANTRDRPMEAAFGDYFVKAVFNDVEARIPWGDNNGNKAVVAHRALREGKGGFLAATAKLAKAMTYVITREGHGGPAEVETQTQRERGDLARMVKDYGLTGKLNELRAVRGEKPLTDAQAVDLLVEYQQKQARPFLGRFAKGTGVVSRLWTAARSFRTLRRETSKPAKEQREEDANGFLFGKVGVKTHATGHDHTFRVQRYMVGGQGDERLGSLLDDATWTDAMPNDSRGAMANLTERRGVITVDFSAQGSHSTLSHWDPVRKRLVPASVLESEEEALGHK